jgi:hypothetical protein
MVPGSALHLVVKKRLLREIQDGRRDTATDRPPDLLDPAERLGTHLTEVKHQGELKHQHSEPLDRGRPLLTTIY